MSHLIAFLRATIAGGFAFFCLYLLATPFVLHARLTGRVEPLYSVALWIVRNALRLAGVKIEVSGRENIPPRTCVYMANHQSNIDPPILFVVLPPRIAMMGKKQLFSIPVLGGTLRAGDFVPVHREDPEEARESVDVALEKLQRGISFLVYPEGHRSRNGAILPFMKPGLRLFLSRVPKRPVYLVVIDGLGHQRDFGDTALRLAGSTVRVAITGPYNTPARDVELDGFIDSLRERMVETLDGLRRDGPETAQHDPDIASIR